jgi:hypothetical protein
MRRALDSKQHSTNATDVMVILEWVMWRGEKSWLHYTSGYGGLSA